MAMVSRDAIIVLLWDIIICKNAMALRKIGKLSSCIYFCNPFTLDAVFIVTIFYCLSIWSIKKAIKPDHIILTAYMSGSLLDLIKNEYKIKTGPLLPFCILCYHPVTI